MNDTVDAPLEIEMLRARHGDAILLGWGPTSDRHRLLIDGGPADAYDDVSARMSELARVGHLDLLVLTHIDADHIEGAILLANDAGVNLGIDEIWFNGPAQLSEELGGAQGEMFAALVGARGIPLNTAFGGRAVRVPEEGPLPVRWLDGGLKLTVLSPDRRALLRQRDAWTTTCENEGLVFGSPEEALVALKGRRHLNPDDTFLGAPEQPGLDDVADLATAVVAADTSIPNASSIVILVEYCGLTLLLPGDATPQALTAGIRRLLAERGLDRVDLNVFKLPHHGSNRNITRELLRLAPADSYLFSSDGGRHGHPDPGSVAKCLVFGKADSDLVFNYCSPQTSIWDDEELLGGWTARFPRADEPGAVVRLPASRAEEVPL